MDHDPTRPAAVSVLRSIFAGAGRSGGPGLALLSGCRRFGFDREPPYAADDFRWNGCRPGGSRRDENQHLLGPHAQLTLMGCFDAKFAGSGPCLHGPEVEGQTLSITCGFDKIDREMYRRRQDLLMVEQARSARRQTVLKPILDEITDHLEVAWIENPARGIAMPKADQNFTLKRRHGTTPTGLTFRA